MIPRFAQEYRAMVADLARTLTEVNIQRARAEVRKLVGENPGGVAGGSQQKNVVAGGLCKIPPS